ncbi:MAG: hypothetical protein J5736_03000, partial [Bacilli bacterium]|nr:hypothetical protein [Bacilli bacterium]
MKKRLLLTTLCLLSFASVLAGCDGTVPSSSDQEPSATSGNPSSEENPSTAPSSTSDTVIPSTDSSSEDPAVSSSQEGGEEEMNHPRTRQEMPTIEVVENVEIGDPETWAGDAYSAQDLGTFYLQDVIDDYVYDWGHSIIQEDGIYKAWWVRPAVYDAIFYAESRDLKNWVNVQRVISLSPNATNIKKYENIKGMLGKPSVVHVGETYYMYFEAPASESPNVTETVLEWDNQVLLATSSDGISWSFHCDANGEPEPVVKMDPAFMHNSTVKNYGDGQPSVFYKDGLFHLTYCHVLYEAGGAPNGIYLATSEDGIHFGDNSTHKRIRDGSGLGITYNTKIGKYMTANVSSVEESPVLDFTVPETQAYSFQSYDTTQIQRGFSEFVKNPHGLVDTETMYIVFLQGARSTTDDWRAGYPTWDGHAVAVNPREYQHRPIVLPNGAGYSQKNYAGYRDRQNSYTKPNAAAAYAAESEIKIDCVKDAIYDQADTIEISRPVYAWGSNFTST